MKKTKNSKTKKEVSVFENEFEQAVAHSVDIMEVGDFVHDSMKEYTLAVAEDRAVPDYRDGLKPVQRRIAHTLYELGAKANAQTKKCGRIVGDTMGKYHPHGDAAIYSALVNMVNTSNPIVTGQGNFGGLMDGAAAPRYTEAKISKLGMAVYECNEVMETVPNYSGEFVEPIVIPTRLPYLLMNGAYGIAVGITSNLPSHNLGELIDGFKYLIKTENPKLSKLMKYVKGPDYSHISEPRGGWILSSSEEIAEVYETGKGSIKYSCSYELGKTKDGLISCKVGSYCPGFDPLKFIEKMSRLAADGYLETVTDLTSKTEHGVLITVKSMSLLKEYVIPALRVSISYQFYVTERNLKENPDTGDREVDISVMHLNLVSLMQRWVDWREDVELKMLELEMRRLRDLLFRQKMRLIATTNIPTITASINQDKIEPRDYLIKNLKSLSDLSKKNKDRAYEGADYILELKLLQLKKADVDVQKKNISDTESNIKAVKHNIDNIDQYLISLLDQLKPFVKPRGLQLSGEYEVPNLLKINAGGSESIIGITKAGKPDNSITERGSADYDFYASSYEGIFVANSVGEACRFDLPELTGKLKGWDSLVGVASVETPFLLFRCDGNKFKALDNSSNSEFVAAKCETMHSMEGYYPKAKLLVWGDKKNFEAISLDSVQLGRKNTRANPIGVSFRNITRTLVLNVGCELIDPTTGKLVSVEEAGKSNKFVFAIGDKNFIITKDGKRKIATKQEVLDLGKGLKKCVPIQFKAKTKYAREQLSE